MHKKGVVWGQSEITQGHRQCHHSIERIRFPIRLYNRNYASFLYRFRDTASYLSKFANIDLPHLHLAPRWGDPVRISKRFLVSESQSPQAIMRYCWRHPVSSRFSRTPICDRHRHRQTDRHKTMAYTAHSIDRAVNKEALHQRCCCITHGGTSRHRYSVRRLPQILH